jgi:hypothetical protein
MAGKHVLVKIETKKNSSLYGIDDRNMTNYYIAYNKSDLHLTNQIK